MKRKKLIILVPLFFMIYSSSYAVNKIKLIQFPYSIFSSKEVIEGIGYGLTIDVTLAAFAKEGVEVDIKTFPLKRSIATFLQGKTAPVMTGSGQVFKKMVQLNEKLTVEDIGMKSMGHFSVQFFYFKEHFPEGIEWTTLRDLRPYKIGALLGVPTIGLLKKANLDLDVTSNIDSLAKKLERNRIDLWQSIGISARYKVQKFFPEKLHDLRNTKQSVYTDDIGLIYWKKDPESSKIAETFVSGLLKLHETGEYQKIYERYLGEGNVPEDILIKKSEIVASLTM